MTTGEALHGLLRRHFLECRSGLYPTYRENPASGLRVPAKSLSQGFAAGFRARGKRVFQSPSFQMLRSRASGLQSAGEHGFRTTFLPPRSTKAGTVIGLT
jgi:hypothetical protein